MGRGRGRRDRAAWRREARGAVRERSPAAARRGPRSDARLRNGIQPARRRHRRGRRSFERRVLPPLRVEGSACGRDPRGRLGPPCELPPSPDGEGVNARGTGAALGRGRDGASHRRRRGGDDARRALERRISSASVPAPTACLQRHRSRHCCTNRSNSWAVPIRGPMPRWWPTPWWVCCPTSCGSGHGPPAHRSITSSTSAGPRRPERDDDFGPVLHRGTSRRPSASCAAPHGVGELARRRRRWSTWSTPSRSSVLRSRPSHLPRVPPRGADAVVTRGVPPGSVLPIRRPPPDMARLTP